MKRSRWGPLACGIAVVAGCSIAGLGAAAAQDDAEPEATIVVDPAIVDSTGIHSLTVTGSGWAPPIPYFVVPCAIPDSGLVADVDTDTCDSGDLVSANVDPSGNLAATISVDIGAAGVMIVAVNGDQSQTAGQAVEVTGDDGGDGLPATGSPSDLTTIVGIACIAAGALVVRSARRR